MRYELRRVRDPHSATGWSWVRHTPTIRLRHPVAKSDRPVTVAERGRREGYEGAAHKAWVHSLDVICDACSCTYSLDMCPERGWEPGDPRLPAGFWRPGVLSAANALPTGGG